MLDSAEMSFVFQSTLPVRGATAAMVLLIRSTHRFQSTLPVRGATTVRREPPCRVQISIHAPRAGSDRGFHFCLEHSEHFNPRSPCGERLACRVPFISPPSVFQSTLPVRGATKLPNAYVTADKFQSTPPVRGATFARPALRLNHTSFQSTPPVRGATR